MSKEKAKPPRTFTQVSDHGLPMEKAMTGAIRAASTGKGRFDLIPPHPVKRIAIHYENGAVKHGDRNWETGLPLHRFLESMERHINDFKSGDRSEDHLAAIGWNLFGYMDTERKIATGTLPQQLNDVPWEDSIDHSPEK